MAAPLRESLRHLRDALHHGRDLAGEVIERSPLPAPVSGLARGMLTELDRVAVRIEGFATEVARDLLGDAPPATSEADRRFGVDLAEAFGVVRDRLGGAEAELDAGAAARAHAEIAEVQGDAARRAALLLEEVVAQAVVPVEAREEARVATFGAVLWLLWGQPHDRAALLACADLAGAIGAEIRAASGRPEGLARLFAEFGDHV